MTSSQAVLSTSYIQDRSAPAATWLAWVAQLTLALSGTPCFQFGYTFPQSRQGSLCFTYLTHALLGEVKITLGSSSPLLGGFAELRDDEPKRSNAA